MLTGRAGKHLTYPNLRREQGGWADNVVRALCEPLLHGLDAERQATKVYPLSIMWRKSSEVRIQA